MLEVLEEDEHHNYGPHRANQCSCVNDGSCWYITGGDNCWITQLPQG